MITTSYMIVTTSHLIVTIKWVPYPQKEYE